MFHYFIYLLPWCFYFRICHLYDVGQHYSGGKLGQAYRKPLTIFRLLEDLT